MHLLSNLMDRKYVALKKMAEDRTEWQKLRKAGSQYVKYMLLSKSVKEELLYDSDQFLETDVSMTDTRCTLAILSKVVKVINHFINVIFFAVSCIIFAKCSH